MKRVSVVLVVMLVVTMAMVAGCAKSEDVTATPEVKKAEPTPAQVEAQKAEDARRAEEARKAEEARRAAEAAEAARRAEEEAAAKERAAKEASAMKPVFFDFDKSFIRDDAKAVMKKNAEWLKANPKAKVRIEGNCDERGTIEYNQALGQRRAAAAKKYLTDLGIKASRISLISYGKEKPSCTDATEDCWQKNRRDDFVVVSE